MNQTFTFSHVFTKINRFLPLLDISKWKTVWSCLVRLTCVGVRECCHKLQVLLHECGLVDHRGAGRGYEGHAGWLLVQTGRRSAQVRAVQSKLISCRSNKKTTNKLVKNKIHVIYFYLSPYASIKVAFSHAFKQQITWQVLGACWWRHVTRRVAANFKFTLFKH